MNVGRRVDYAVARLSFLAGQPGGSIVSRADIEKSQDIPSFYLSKIMKDLVAGGWCTRISAPRAVLRLPNHRTSISIKDIYETVERPLALMECLEKGAITCSYCAVCSQKSVWQGGAGGVREFLAKLQSPILPTGKDLRNDWEKSAAKDGLIGRR